MWLQTGESGEACGEIGEETRITANEYQIIQMHSTGFENGSHSLPCESDDAVPRDCLGRDFPLKNVMRDYVQLSDRIVRLPIGGTQARCEKDGCRCRVHQCVQFRDWPAKIGRGSTWEPTSSDPWCVTRRGFALRRLPIYKKCQLGKWQLHHLFTSIDGD